MLDSDCLRLNSYQLLHFVNFFICQREGSPALQDKRDLQRLTILAKDDHFYVEIFAPWAYRSMERDSMLRHESDALSKIGADSGAIEARRSDQCGGSSKGPGPLGRK